MNLGALLRALAASITQDGFFFAAEEGMSLGDIGHVGGCTHHRVDQARACVHGDVRLHPKVPRVAFSGLVHLGVARLGPVLGGWRRGDDRRIDNRALAQERATLGEQRVDLREEAFGQVMAFEWVTELEQRRGIGNRLAAHESPHRPAVAERVLQRLVGQRVPLLQKVDARHSRDAQRRAAPFAFGIKRLDQRHQARPRRRHFHLPEKTLAAGQLLLGRLLSHTHQFTKPVRQQTTIKSATP